MVNQLLQATDLQYMRAETRKAMPDTISIQRKSLDSDQQGGFTESWADAYQDVPARLAAGSSREVASTGRQDLQADFTLTVAYDQSIEQTDRVVHASGTFEVQSIDAGKSWIATKRCQMRRL